MYSSCGPIQNQTKSLPSWTATARWDALTRADQYRPTFLNRSDGCLGFASRSSKFLRAVCCSASGSSWKCRQKLGAVLCT